MHSVGKDWRNKNINMLDPRQYNIESYYTDALQKKEMKHSFGEDLLNNLHLHPDALKKNLADTIITSEEKKPTKRDKNLLNMATVDAEPPIMENSANAKHMSSFAGISNFFSGVLSVISGAVAQLRPKSPAHAQYYDCFDDSLQGPPQAWHSSNGEVQNKSVLTAHSNSKSDMNVDCKTAAAQCEDKLNKVRFLLTTKPIQTSKLRPRRPKKVFVEPGSVEESFEDAFAPEDFISIANSKFIEYYSPFEIHKENLLQTSSPKVKTEKTVLENTDIVKTLPEVEFECENVKCETENKMVNHVVDSKTVENNVCEGKELEKSSREELVSSCEDKLSKLKALLQEKHKKNTTANTSPDSTPETVAKSIDIHHKPPKLHDKTKNKHYKNPCRTTDKRKKGKLRKSIQDDLLFAQEINNEELSGVENSPSINSLDRLSESNNSLEKVIDTTNSSVEYFDEVSGRFRTASTTESEDSFQIVFKDNVKEKRVRRASDCDSEDSFIVFEETPDNCYTSNDVFGDSNDSGSEYTDSDSDLSDNEDGLAKKICHTLSRTLCDLTDGSLYEDKTEDEVDCAVRKVCDIASQEISDLSDQVQHMDIESRSNGVLLTEAKKLQRKDQPPKTVSFSTQPPKVHVMRVWAFAARQARAGHWERCALDRDRFKRRIADVDMAVSWVLKPQHRSRVMFQRFMPWWNAQRRKELAEKKARAEEEKVKEAERLKREAELEEESKKQNVEELVNGNADVLNDNDCGKQLQSNDISNDNGSVDSNVVNATNDKVKNDVANKTSVNCNKLDTCNISVASNRSVDSNVIINDANNGKVANKTSVNLKKQNTCNISLGNNGSVVSKVIINNTKNGKVANGDIAINSKANFKSVGVVIKNEINKSILNVDVAVKTKIVPVNGVQDFKSKCRNETLSNT